MEEHEAVLADLVRRRQLAERAVEDMPEGPRKERAFEVLLRSLLEERTGEPGLRQNGKPTKQKAVRPRAKQQAARRARAGPLTHVRQLVEGGYFDEPRRLPEIVQSLRLRGHLYDQPPVSGALLRLTRREELRRIPEKDDKGRKVYIYQKALG
jgi:hypothetical protein